MPMDQEIKKEWCERLNSGEYLRSNNGYMCSKPDGVTPRYDPYGVLCEIAEERGIIKSLWRVWDWLPFPVRMYATMAFGQITAWADRLLPEEVRRWCDLSRVVRLEMTQERKLPWDTYVVGAVIPLTLLNDDGIVDWSTLSAMIAEQL